MKWILFVILCSSSAVFSSPVDNSISFLGVLKGSYKNVHPTLKAVASLNLNNGGYMSVSDIIREGSHLNTIRNVEYNAVNYFKVTGRKYCIEQGAKHYVIDNFNTTFNFDNNGGLLVLVSVMIVCTA